MSTFVNADPPLPSMGRRMALDIGQKRVGVALSDLMAQIAQPWVVLDRYPKLGERIKALIDEHEVIAIIVGRPLTLRGEVGPAIVATEKCVEEIRPFFSVPLIWWDERLTTRAAEREMITQGVRRQARRERIDKVAAALLLQSYLDSPKPVAYSQS